MASSDVGSLGLGVSAGEEGVADMVAGGDKERQILLVDRCLTSDGWSNKSERMSDLDMERGLLVCESSECRLDAP